MSDYRRSCATHRVAKKRALGLDLANRADELLETAAFTLILGIKFFEAAGSSVPVKACLPNWLD